MIEKIYFDMDGVLVDFKNGIQNIAHVNQDETDDEMWLKIKEVDHFYYKLKSSSFKQQRLPAWRPVPTLLSIIIFYVLR